MKKTRYWSSSKPHDQNVMVTKAADTVLPLDTNLQYFNRELSDLAFIERVLDESSNENHPLLERLRFLSISATVLDQFYTVRVARMRRKIDSGNNKPSVDGLTPAMQLEKINWIIPRSETIGFLTKTGL